MALEGYDAVLDAFSRSSFTPAKQQVVCLAINCENERTCRMAGHTVLARQAELPEDVIRVIREGEPAADPPLEAPRRFAAAMTTERGHVGNAAVERFPAIGFTRAPGARGDPRHRREDALGLRQPRGPHAERRLHGADGLDPPASRADAA